MSGATLSDGFERALRVLDDRFGATHAALLVADAKQRTLSVQATYRMSPEDLRPRRGLGVAGRVAESGRPIVVPSLSTEPMGLADFAQPRAWQGRPLSLVCVPVSVDGRMAGALSVYFGTDPTARFVDWLAAVDTVATSIARAYRAARWSASTDLGREPSDRAVFEYANMIGTTAVMRQVYEEIAQVARTTATALILGESGTGKELVAQAIHDNSDRARQPFIKVHAAAFPETLFESELFGHERGAFTGAVTRKKGRIDLAQGGTLFLDEIGELPLPTQVKLLRVLQSREYERLGGTETLKADIRLIAATNKNMAAAVSAGTFREDLYYRLNVFTITLPALRDRRADVPTLSEYFLQKFAREHRREVRSVSSGAIDVLSRHAWPGNVRELENAIERAVVVCGGLVIEEWHLPDTLRHEAARPLSTQTTLAEAVEQLERRMIEDALRESNGNLARASRALGTTERILRYKVGKYQVGAARGPGQSARAPAPPPDPDDDARPSRARGPAASRRA